MKKNDIYTPSRQSPFAIVQIIYKSYISLIKQLWPVLILVFVRDGGMTKIAYLAIATVAISMIVSIIRYFKYYYYVEGDSLIVQSGLITKSVKNIPFSKIQTIDYEQNIIHKICNVVQVKIDTAGTGKEELSMDALSFTDAEKLRSFILSSKDMMEAITTEESLEPLIPQEEVIISLSFKDILKVGILENHLQSGGIILLAILSFWERLNELNIFGEISRDDVSNFMQSLRVAVIVGVLFIVISFLFSIIRMTLSYFNLSFSRVMDGFTYRAGLFTTQQVSLKDYKIQTLSWSSNMLQGLLGISDIYLRHASSKEVDHKKSIRIPGCSSRHINDIISYLYPDASDFLYKYHSDTSFFKRYLIYLIPVILIATSFCLYVREYLYMGGCILVGALLLLHRYKRSKKLSIRLSESLMHISYGSFGEKFTLVPHYKIQSIELSQSPYQRRADVANITIYTSAQNIRIPYIKLNDALFVYDYVLYKIESSTKNWM